MFLRREPPLHRFFSGAVIFLKRRVLLKHGAKTFSMVLMFPSQQARFRLFQSNEIVYAVIQRAEVG